MRCVCVVCVRVVVVAAASSSNSGGNRVRRQTPRIEDIQYLEVGKICKLTQKAEELHTNVIPQKRSSCANDRSDLLLSKARRRL